MNDFRLSTNTNTISIIDEKTKDKFLYLSPYFSLNSEGQIINIQTGKVVRDTYVVEVVILSNSTDQVVVSADNINRTTIYSTISDCSKSLGVSRSIITQRLNRGISLFGTTKVTIRKIRVFNKI